MAQALVPLKDLVRAKSRLAGLLRPSERRALVQAMAEDVLVVLANHPGLRQVTLLSDDPGAGLLASQYGIRCWPEHFASGRGLNQLVARASARLLAEADEPLLVLHADLPLLTAADISAVLARQCQLGGLVIGCDGPGTGTNLLAFAASSVPPFCFGPDSAAKHGAAARAAGIPVALVRRPGLALDVDEPRDLALLLQELGSAVHGKTAGLLQATALGARIELALATLEARDGRDQRVDPGAGS